MFNLIPVGYNTFIVVKENNSEDTSYGYIRVNKFSDKYLVSVKAVANEVYQSGEYKSLEEKAIKIAKQYDDRQKH